MAASTTFLVENFVLIMDIWIPVVDIGCSMWWVIEDLMITAAPPRARLLGCEVAYTL